MKDTIDMNLNKLLVRKHFNRQALNYDRYAVVQQDMACKLAKQVEKHIAQTERILEIGCGTGNLTAKLLSLAPGCCQVVAMDISESMISAAKRKLGVERAERVRFIVGDAEEIMGSDEPELRDGAFDLIVSNATFQWFNDPQSTIEALLRKLRPGGVVAFSTFGPSTFRELHESFAAAERSLHTTSVPHGQAFLDGEFWRSAFHSGTTATSSAQWMWSSEIQRMIYPSVHDFLYAIKRIGAGNAMKGAETAGLRGRRLFQEMERHYMERFSCPGGVWATYELGFGLYIL